MILGASLPFLWPNNLANLIAASLASHPELQKKTESSVEMDASFAANKHCFSIC